MAFLFESEKRSAVVIVCSSSFKLMDTDKVLRGRGAI